MRTTLTYVISSREKFRSKITNEVFGSLDQDVELSKEVKDLN